MNNKDSLNIINRVREKWSPVYLFIGLFGILGISNAIAGLIANAITGEMPQGINQYLIEFFWYPGKTLEICRYCISITFIILYIVWIVFNTRSKYYRENWHDFFANASWSKIVPLCLAWISLNFLLYQLSFQFNLYLIAPLGCIWFALLNFPYRGLLSNRFTKFFQKHEKVISIGIIALACLEILYVFEPFVFARPKIINEFFDIPEATLLWRYPNLTADTSEKLDTPILVDNFHYIKDHNILCSRTSRSIAHIDLHEKSTNSLGVITDRSLALDEFIKKNDAVCYDDNTHSLYVVSPLTAEDIMYVCTLLENPEKKSAFLAQNAELEQFRREAGRRRYTPQEIEFIQANRREIHEQVLNRWVIHHQAHMFCPMNELSLGRPASQINFLYGFPNAWCLEKLIKLINGDITYQGYVHILYSFYYIYFLAYILLCFAIFRNALAVCICAIGAATAAAASGFDTLMLGPGYNPLRHILDLPTIYVIWTAINAAGNKASFSWLLAFLLCIASIFNNIEFGIILSLSTLGSYLWFAVMETTGKKLLGKTFFSIIVFIGFCICAKFSNIGEPGYGMYFLKGMLGFPIYEWRLLPLLILSALIAWILISNWSEKQTPVSAEVKLMCFLFLLFVQSATYYIWNPEKTHLLTLLPAFLILCVMLMYHCIKRFNQPQYYMIYSILFLCAMMIGNISSISYYQIERVKYNAIFSSHHVFSWNFSRMKVDTTMDPMPFAESISMLKKYSKEPAIHIISKYDTILPFLSNRYSAMKYFELSQFMITQLETTKIIESLKKDNPEVLFVDSDIQSPRGLDIISPGGFFGYLHDESRWRAMRLDLLKDVFDSVRDKYILSETGPLISVWRRIK